MTLITQTEHLIQVTLGTPVYFPKMPLSGGLKLVVHVTYLCQVTPLFTLSLNNYKCQQKTTRSYLLIECSCLFLTIHQNPQYNYRTLSEYPLSLHNQILGYDNW